MLVNVCVSQPHSCLMQCSCGDLECRKLKGEKTDCDPNNGRTPIIYGGENGSGGGEGGIEGGGGNQGGEGGGDAGQ